MRVANGDVLVSSMQLRSPTWSADLREHGGHLYVNEKRDIVTSNYLEARVPDAVNPVDKCSAARTNVVVIVMSTITVV
jgi:hypothetical protein